MSKWHEPDKSQIRIPVLLFKKFPRNEAVLRDCGLPKWHFSLQPSCPLIVPLQMTLLSLIMALACSLVAARCLWHKIHADPGTQDLGIRSQCWSFDSFPDTSTDPSFQSNGTISHFPWCHAAFTTLSLYFAWKTLSLSWSSHPFLKQVLILQVPAKILPYFLIPASVHFAYSHCILNIHSLYINHCPIYCISFLIPSLLQSLNVPHHSLGLECCLPPSCVSLFCESDSCSSVSCWPKILENLPSLLRLAVLPINTPHQSHYTSITLHQCICYFPHSGIIHEYHLFARIILSSTAATDQMWLMNACSVASPHWFVL